MTWIMPGETQEHYLVEYLAKDVYITTKDHDGHQYLFTNGKSFVTTIGAARGKITREIKDSQYRLSRGYRDCPRVLVPDDFRVVKVTVSAGQPEAI